jgi:hypothetical protein
MPEVLKLSFEFELSFIEDIDNDSKDVEIDAIKDYINNHLQEIQGYRNFATKINNIKILNNA